MESILKTFSIVRKMQAKGFDAPFAIVGRERIGKSTLGLHGTEFFGGNINNVALGKESVGTVLKYCKMGAPFDYDEAIDGAFNRESLSQWNKDLVKAFAIIGAKKLVSFIILPDFFLLDEYFRKYRLAGVFYVYKRGHVAFFDRNGIKKINKYGKSNHEITGASPLYYDTFPEYRGAMLDEYLSRKFAKIELTIQNLDKKGTGSKRTVKDKIKAMLKDGKQPPEIAQTLNTAVHYVYETKAEMPQK
jgi:hypothetical protein